MSRVGSVVFATEQGIGRLAKLLFDQGVLTDVLVLAHGRRTSHHETWYPNQPYLSSLHNKARLREFVQSMDAMLFIETPFEWEMFRWCRDRRIPTLLMPMYECMPTQLPQKPDVMLCPSLLDRDVYLSDSQIHRVVHLNVPIDPLVRWKLRAEKVTTFIHNGGNGGLKGRNGTQKVLEALPYLDGPCKVIVRSQIPLQIHKNHLKVRPGVELQIIQQEVPFQQLYEEGDVFVFPEEFNGLCLPLQEAFAAGFPCIALNRYPINRWLPTRLLVEPRFTVKDQVSSRCNSFDRCVSAAEDLAARMNEVTGQDLSVYSQMGRTYHENMQVEKLIPIYHREIERVIAGKKRT